MVGDAGYFKDPITAHGITDALRDAEILARAVKQALDRPSAEAEALTKFAELREQVSHDFFDLTERIASYRWSLDEIKSLLRQLSKAMNPEVELLLRMDTAAIAA